MNPYDLGGLLLAGLGCVSIYLSSAHQLWLARAWRAAPSRAAGVLLLMGGLAVLWRGMQPVVAVYVWVTWIMLVGVSMPYLGAWLRRGDGKESSHEG